MQCMHVLQQLVLFTEIVMASITHEMVNIADAFERHKEVKLVNQLHEHVLCLLK
jgi:hypothetical protein